MKKILTILTGFTLLLSAQGEEKSSKEFLRDGLFEEEVNQDFSKAEAAYRSVTKRYDEERYFAGLAFFRLAEIARKSGKNEDALALYRRVASEFSDQKEIAKRATSQLGDAGVKVNQIAIAGPPTTPISKAEAVELQRLQKMERDSPDLLNGVGEDGWHPIHKAASNGWTGAVDFLLERKVEVDPRTTEGAKYHTHGFTPLHLAVIHGHLTVVDRLLAAKADPSLIVQIKPEDFPLPVQTKNIPVDSASLWSPLHFSILYQRRGIMTRLLKAKAPLDAGGPLLARYTTTSGNRSGNSGSINSSFKATPLIMAVWLNDTVAFQTLMDHGADINQAASDEGETPLLAAIWQNSDLTTTLIDQGANVTSEHIFGRTLLHWALELSQPPIIKLLVSKGADVNVRVTRSQNRYEGHPSPLEAVNRWNLSAKQKEELCDVLIKAGARPTPRVLITAASGGRIQTMKACLNAGVDPNGSYDRGDRALHFAKDTQTARLLIEAGAHPDAKNHDGITPLGNIIHRDDTPQVRALIDYLIDQGAKASVFPSLLSSQSPNMGDKALLPYIMSKTELAGKSDPKAITFAFPKNWSFTTGADLVIPGTPAPSLQELLSLNFEILTRSRVVKRSSKSSRISPRPGSTLESEVVTDLAIYRPNEKGELEEVAQLADREATENPAPELHWGDIVLFRTGAKQNDKQQEPLIHYVSGQKPINVTFKVGSWKHRIAIDSSPGLELRDHFSSMVSCFDFSKTILQRAGKEPKTINLTLTHDPKKIRLIDGDTIEFSLKPQSYYTEIDPFTTDAGIHLLFPDLPAKTLVGGSRKETVLSEILHHNSLLEGRDFSQVKIQRMGKDGLEVIPLNFLEASRNLSENQNSMPKALEFLKTPLFPGDILIFPPRKDLSWVQRNTYSPPVMDEEIGVLVNLVKPAPRTPRPKAPVIRSSSKSTSPTKVRRTPILPSR